MSYNESETRFYLIDPVLRVKGYDAHWKLKMETPAPVEPTGNRGRRRAGGGRTDYLLCVQAPLSPDQPPLIATNWPFCVCTMVKLPGASAAS